ncbi:zinc ABC transporter substrate-binding protein [Simkania negevensis]|uniref:Zinc ABC transporter substrate-binding protein n=1 Tax=Simkania negevensis TaxID=83561 RepID=A0ABS3AQ61_9BACT|nr:zinc ABC transporter substrate-binding protein [Simkania negevensis]
MKINAKEAKRIQRVARTSDIFKNFSLISLVLYFVRHKFLFVLLMPLLAFTGCTNSKEQTVSLAHPPSLKVLVTIEPYRYLVDRLAEGRVEVVVLVPPGGNPHAYELTPREASRVESANIWFFLGDQTERSLLEMMESKKNPVQMVDLREALPLIEGAHCHTGHCHEGADPHIWLSPKLLKIQAGTIAAALQKQDPESAGYYQDNLTTLLADLDKIDAKLEDLLVKAVHKTFIISHPSLGYFCRDYGCEQLPLEQEGKEPTIKYQTAIIMKARERGVCVVFAQEQFHKKPAELIAKHLHARLTVLDPYSYHFLQELELVAAVLVEQKSCSED